MQIYNQVQIKQRFRKNYKIYLKEYHKVEFNQKFQIIVNKLNHQKNHKKIKYKMFQYKMFQYKMFQNKMFQLEFYKMMNQIIMNQTIMNQILHKEKFYKMIKIYHKKKKKMIIYKIQIIKTKMMIKMMMTMIFNLEMILIDYVQFH